MKNLFLKTSLLKFIIILNLFNNIVFSKNNHGSLNVNIVPEKYSGTAIFATKFHSFVSGGSGFYSFSWDFNLSDGVSVEKISSDPGYIFPFSGKYIVTLIVKDTEGNTGTDTCNIEVFPFQLQKSNSIEKENLNPKIPYVIENLEITNNNGNGITLRNCSNVIIRNNYIHNLTSLNPFGEPGSSGCAIYLFDCENVTIENNYCKDNFSGIFVVSPPNNKVFKKNINIINNVVTGSKYDRSINVFQADSLLIENNYTYNNGDMIYFQQHRAGGIWVWDSQNIIINDNITLKSSSDGIGLATTEQMMKLDPTFHCDNYIISNNTIKYNNEMGIWLTGVRNGLIFNNYIDSNNGTGSSGINLEWNVSNTKVYRNSISNNTVSGICSNNSSNNELYENVIHKQMGGHGAIWFRQSFFNGSFTYPIINTRNNIIRNNLIYNNSHGIKLVGSDGITLKLSGTLIANNTIDGNDKYWENNGSGIIIQNEIDSTTIINNIISNNSGIGIVNNKKDINIRYNNVWNNNLGNYYGCTKGIGDISTDPLFVNRLEENYHLQKYSACIDAGDPESDYKLEIVPNGNRIDQGCYGNTPEAAKTTTSILKADLSKLEIYPIPFYYSRDETIIFRNIPANININVYNILGELTLKINSTGNKGYYNWDVKRNRISSGIYFYCLSDIIGLNKYGKLIILK